MLGRRKVDPHDAPSVLRQGLEVALRLCAVKRREGELLAGNLDISPVPCGHQHVDARIRTALVELPGRVQIPRAQLYAHGASRSRRQCRCRAVERTESAFIVGQYASRAM